MRSPWPGRSEGVIRRTATKWRTAQRLTPCGRTGHPRGKTTTGRPSRAPHRGWRHRTHAADGGDPRDPCRGEPRAAVLAQRSLPRGWHRADARRQRGRPRHRAARAHHGSRAARHPSGGRRAAARGARHDGADHREPRGGVPGPCRADDRWGRRVRSAATVAGNLFAPAPYGDFAAALLALGASIEFADGRREALDDLSRLSSRGLVAQIHVPDPRGAFYFRKVTRVRAEGASR